MYNSGYMKPTAEQVIKLACKRTGLTLGQIQHGKRNKAAIYAATIIVRVLTDKYGWSSGRIGKLLNRDHSTILDYYHGNLNGKFITPPAGNTADDLINEVESKL